MKEEQVHVIVVPVHIEVDLPADEGESGPELAERLSDPAGQGVLVVAFGDFAGQAEVFKVVGFFGNLLGEF